MVKRGAAGPGRILLVCLALAGGALLPTSGAAFELITDVSCEPGEILRWRGGASPWHLNELGARDLEFEAVERVFEGAFAAWSEPCCSGFTSRYMGATKRRLHWPIQENVIFFEGERWPPELGTSRGVIGATVFFRESCSIVGSLIAFNEIDYTFFDTDQDLARMDVDLRYVGAHEVGHWLGVAHSEEPDAIMRPKYTSDLLYEGLSADDVEAVCTVYPGSCQSCEGSDDCPADSVCREGACVASECRDTLDCPRGSVCSDQLCVPGCRSHDECPAGQGCSEASCVELPQRCEKHVDCEEGESCVGRRCRQQPETCSTCSVCRMDSDCGLDESCIATDRADRVGFCTNPCATDRDCVGDAVCRRPAGAPSNYCLDPAGGNPDAVCRQGYACTVAEPGPELGCALLGEACTNGSFGCGGRADTCVDLEEGPVCSCTCRSDEECGAGARCLPDPSNGIPSCYPEDHLLPCEASFCAPGQRCTEEGCAEDPCAGVVCEGEASCVEGDCVLPKPAPKAKSKGGCAAADPASVALVGLWGAVGFLALSRRRSQR